MPDRPRVLQIGPDPAVRGGMPAALQSLLDSPLAERYKLDLDSTYRGPGLPRGLLVFVVALARLVLWSTCGRGRIVHVHATIRGSSYRKAVFVLVAKAMRRRVLLHMHSGAHDIDGFAGSRPGPVLSALSFAFGRADLVLAVSAASARALESAYGLDGVVVVPNAAPPLVEFERPPLGGGEPITVAYLGGFANPAKAGDVMLDAAKSALAERSDLRIVLAGPGDLPPTGIELVASEAEVEWVGWLDAAEKDALLRRARVFVMSSRSEGLPMALLEAMSYGLAIVATDVGGIGEVARAGKSALLVDAEDAPALGRAIAALAGDPELRSRLAAGARDEAVSLSAGEVAGRLASIYEALL